MKCVCLVLRNGMYVWFCFLVQTSFVDCLIEQTHPEIEGGYDRDVSINFVKRFEILVNLCLFI